MSARDVIEQSNEFRLACEQAMRSPLVVADHIVRDLETAGYAILSPDEMRGIRDGALEEAALMVDATPVGDTLSPKIRCAAAIRSLKGGRDAQ